MFDYSWAGVHPDEHPDVEIDGQADDGLDVPSVSRCRGGYHRENQTKSLEKRRVRSDSEEFGHEGNALTPS
jgi:hypothetical protein